MSQPQEREPRELTPVQMFWDGRQGVRDFGPHVLPADAPEVEVKEVEEAITPVPKDESALASAVSQESQPVNQPPVSEIPVPPAPTVTTDKSTDADKENGKDSKSNEGDTESPKTTSPSPESSSPSSSSEAQTSPGSPAPPALPKLPTAVQTQKP